MRSWSGLVLGGAILSLCGCSDSLGAAKDFKLVPLLDQGRTVTLADYKGKTVLLDFWATYCGPCKDAMPEIQKMWDKYRSKGFEVVSVSPEPRPLVLAFHQSAPFTYPVFLDPGGEADQTYRVAEIPTFVLIRDGQILWQESGFRQGDITNHVETVME